MTHFSKFMLGIVFRNRLLEITYGAAPGPRIHAGIGIIVVVAATAIVNVGWVFEIGAVTTISGGVIVVGIM
jgi:hypothetical protein